MRSGWPHTGDGQGMQPADQRHVPFGPEVSWPNGYSDVEYRNGDYRYHPLAAQPSADGPGQHPYAAFDASGYGDDGYSDPGYQGPSAQDAGIAGTRTVRGFVEAGQGQHGYAPHAGYAQSSYFSGYERPDYAGSSYAGSSYAAGGDIELAYPAGASAPDAYRSSELYQEPWDYEQPLRYDGEEEAAYPVSGGYQQDSGYRGQDDGAVRYQPPAFDPAAYNGSDYSMPGVNGPGYDLAGIIGTSDFEAIGYDQPSYGRLSYDDPRYEQPRYDGPRFDETRLDNLWLAGDDVRREAEPTGYGNDGFGDSRNRSGYSSGFPSGGFASLGTDRGRGMSADTRFDMKALSGPANDHTRFDVPAFDETRLDNLRAVPRLTGPQRAATAVLAPPAFKPRGWAEDTSLDHFADLDLTDEPVPAAFTRTLERPERLEQDDDTATRRATGRRRGRSGDRRQWMALGAIAVVAAGAIGGVLMKYVFSGPSGPAHQVVAPQTVAGFERNAILEKEMHVATEAQQVSKASSGQASDVAYAVYKQGDLQGVSSQVFMFVGGKLAGADPAASVANFEQAYKGSVAVSAGSLGGQAACTETHLNGQSASMCVWFDNDTFGTVVSSTMTTAKLAATMDAVRPNLETLAK
jgi:hypothetical protein